LRGEERRQEMHHPGDLKQYRWREEREKRLEHGVPRDKIGRKRGGDLDNLGVIGTSGEQGERQKRRE